MSDHHLDLEKLLQSLVEKLQNGDSLTTEQSTQAQSILSNVKCRDLTTGNITQILFIVQRSELFKPIEISDNIPRSGTVKFVGRADAIKSIFEKLQQNNLLAITVIEGMGGVGKTELAIQYALFHRVLKTYKGGICWFTAKNENVGSQILQFARNQLGLEPPEKFDLRAKVDFCWSHWQEGDVLVVIDDIEDYSEVKQYLPPQLPRFKVLITTRLKELPLLQHLKLDVLSESEALELLQGWVGEKKVKQELEDAKKICNFLGCLPLALNLVGAYVGRRGTTLADMLKRLETQKLAHGSLGTPDKKTNTSYVERGVSDAFELSWEQLNESAQQLGCLLSLFALAPIPWSLVESAAPEQDSEALEDARVELEKLYLLQGKDTYKLHQLIRVFFQEKLAKLELEQVDKLQRSFCQVMVAVAQGVPEFPTQQDIQVIAPAMPHLAGMVKDKMTLNNSILNDEDFCLPFVGLGRFYTALGLNEEANQQLYEEAKLCYQDYLSRAKERFGGEANLEVAAAKNNLANIYKHLGDYNQAKSYYLQALNLSVQLLRENHIDVATITNNLALLYLHQKVNREVQYFSRLSYYKQVEKCYMEARKLLRQALKIRKFCLGEDHPTVAQSLNNLGILYVELASMNSNYLGYYTKAEKLLHKAFDIRRRTLKEDHPDIAESQNNLAYLYTKMRRYTEAEGLYFDALRLNKRLLVENHPNVARTLGNLGELYVTQNRYDNAKPLLLQALEILKSRFGNEHPEVIFACKRLEDLRHKLE